ncbi:MAG TPA: CBS domain-containing protein [Paucimonas sp.]|nr:CBS domain-containing protein [Paucimonas sp.]HJW55612.1 CBS domain-containing protein [Burkholderiaceae bacterium]
MPISECCNLGVVCCGPGASLPEVAALMRRHHVGDVVVVEQKDEARMPIGVVTDRDIVIETLALGLDANVFTAGDIMSTPVVAIQENADLIETLRRMRSHKIRRMPVLKADGSLFGIVTSDDIINMLSMELSLMTGVIVEQPNIEAKTHR